MRRHLKTVSKPQREWLRRQWRKCVGHVVHSSRDALTEDEMRDLRVRVEAVGRNKKPLTIVAREEALERFLHHVACRYYGEQVVQFTLVGRVAVTAADVVRGHGFGRAKGRWYELSHPIAAAAMCCDQSSVGLMLRRTRGGEVDPVPREV